MTDDRKDVADRIVQKLDELAETISEHCTPDSIDLWPIAWGAFGCTLCICITLVKLHGG